MLFMLCTCMVLRLLENGSITVEMTKSQLCLYDADVGDFAYYDYDIVSYAYVLC